MEVLPGLRRVNPPIESPKPAVRDGAEPARESSRFDEHLNQAREQHAKMNETSRAEDSAARSRPEATKNEIRRSRETRPEETKSDDAPDSAQSPADVEARAPAPKQSPPAADPVRADRARPEVAVEVEPAAPAAPVDAAPIGQGETPKPASTKESPTAAAPAQLEAGVIASAFSTAVQPSQKAPSVSLEASKAILGDGSDAKLAGDELTAKTVSATEPAANGRLADVSANVASDALARANPASANAPQDFARDLAQLMETADARAPHANHAPAANESAAEILRQVRVGLSADLREASIQLAPEALGRVFIRMRVEHGALTADVRAESSQALRALELHAPELKAALAQHGIEPRSIAFSFMNSHPGDGPGRGHASPSRPPRAGFAPVEMAPLAVERALARRLSASGVDTYA